jgi:hypothetical protein
MPSTTNTTTTYPLSVIITSPNVNVIKNSISTNPSPTTGICFW